MPRTPFLFRIPLIAKLLIGLVIGVILSFYGYGFWFPLWAWLLLALCFGVLLQFKVLKKMIFNRFYGAILSFVFIGLGIQIAEWSRPIAHPSYFETVKPAGTFFYQARLLGPIEEKTNSYKCVVAIERVGKKKCVGEALLYLEKSEQANELVYGDVLLLNGTFNPISANGNPKEFDYARYLRIHGIYHQTYLKTTQWMKVGNDATPFYSTVYAFRALLTKTLEGAALSPSSLMVAKALLLGKKESLDRDTLRTFSSAGAMHVLAVSGLHVGIIMLLFSAIFAPVKRVKNGKSLFVILILLIIWSYAFVTGMSSSVMRATVMFSFVIVGRELERDTTIYQSILVSAFLLIVAEPFVIFQVGFQLSYLAVLGIVFLQPKIYNLMYSKYFLVDKLWQITAVSIAAQISTFPLGLYYFHQFPNFFFISNLIVIPTAFAILLVGIFYFFVAWLPFVEWCVAEVLNGLIVLLNTGVKWIENLPYSIYWGVSIHWFEVIWLYITLLLLSFAFMLRKKKLLFMGITGTLLILLFNVAEQQWQHHQRQLVVYNVNESTAIDVFNGRTNAFISDSTLMADEEKLLFHVKHNWFYKTGQEQPVAYYNLNEKPLIKFGSETLLFLSDAFIKKHPVQLPKTDFIYLYEIDYLPKKIIDYLVVENKYVILGKGVGYKLSELIRTSISPINLHELREEGAFQRYF